MHAGRAHQELTDRVWPAENGDRVSCRLPCCRLLLLPRCCLACGVALRASCGLLPRGGRTPILLLLLLLTLP